MRFQVLQEVQQKYSSHEAVKDICLWSVTNNYLLFSVVNAFLQEKNIIYLGITLLYSVRKSWSNRNFVTILLTGRDIA